MEAEDRTHEANRLTPMQFILAFGVVSMLANVVYEGARAITGPYLATFGASATLVGFVTGFGEAGALVFRLATGRLSDRTHRYWALSDYRVRDYRCLSAIAGRLADVVAGGWAGR